MCVDMMVIVCVECMHVSVNQLCDPGVDGVLSGLPCRWWSEWSVRVSVGVVEIVQ